MSKSIYCNNKKSFYNKTTAPKCSCQPKCVWRKKQGCLKAKNSRTKQKNTEYCNNKQKTYYKKNKDPKCTENNDCKWVKKVGCLKKVPREVPKKKTIKQIREECKKLGLVYDVKTKKCRRDLRKKVKK